MSNPAISKYGVDTSGSIFEPPPGLDPDCLLFLGDPERKTYSSFQRYWMPVSACTVFFLGSLYSNRTVRLPFMAGIHKHALRGLFGLALGEGSWRVMNKYGIERDLQYYHYMVLHPEDFQAPEKKKFGQVLYPWIPVR